MNNDLTFKALKNRSIGSRPLLIPEMCARFYQLLDAGAVPVVRLD